MTEAYTPHYDDKSRRERASQIIERLNFRETAAMAGLREKVKTVPVYETAMPLFIEYRTLAEQEADKLDDDDQRLLAQVGIPIGMVALYLENPRFTELTEYIDSELDDAWQIANNLPIELMPDDLLDMIGSL